MEDAHIKSGDGLADRDRSEDMENRNGLSVADYAKMRQVNNPGNEIYETRKVIKERQKPLRTMLEGRIKRLVIEDLKHQ